MKLPRLRDERRPGHRMWLGPGRKRLLAIALALAVVAAVTSLVLLQRWRSSDATGSCSVTVSAGQDVAASISAHPQATICLAAGTYDLSSPLQLTKGQSLVGTTGTVLRGSVRLTTWQHGTYGWQTTATGAIGLDDAAECENQSANLCRIQNRIYLDGNPLSLVATPQAVTTGTAYINPSTRVIIIGTNPQGHEVRESRCSRAVLSTASGTSVRDLTVTQFATPAQLGAVELGSDSTVQGVTVSAVHGVGIKLSNATDSTVTDNLVLDNGQLGISVYAATNFTLRGNRVVGNNVDGFWVNDWESGGVKFTESSGTVSDNSVDTNKGPGLWVDVHCDGITFTDNSVSNNSSDGIRLEISRNITVSDNTLSGNGAWKGRGSTTGVWATGGITVNTAESVQISDNLISGSGTAVSLQARVRGTGPWGTYALRNVTVTSNVMELPASGTFGYVRESSAASQTNITFTTNTYAPLAAAATGQWLDSSLSLSAWRSEHEPSAVVR